MSNFSIRVEDFKGSILIDKKHLDYVDRIVKKAKFGMIFDNFYSKNSIEDEIMNLLSFCKDRKGKAERLKRFLKENLGKNIDFLRKKFNE